MREHYECMRGDALIEAETQTDLEVSTPLPIVSGDSRPLTNANLRRSCEVHACAASADVMAQELDRALATPRAHEPGALVVCRSPG